MEHTEEQWASLQIQLELLRDQNKMLKQMIEDMRAKEELDNQFSLIRSSIQPVTMKNCMVRQRNFTCPHCLPHQKSKQQLVNQLQSWSDKLNFSLFKKKDTELRRSISGDSNQSPLKQKQSLENYQGLIEKICLFGPKEENSVVMQNKKIQVPHQLYFPSKDPLFSLYESYGYSLYPQAVQVKIIREKNKSIEIDRVIFRKSLKPSDCKLIIFQSKDEFCLPQNAIKKKLNPFSTVYCVSIDFPDYLFSDKPFIGQLNRTLSLSQDRIDCQKIEKTSNSPQKGTVSPTNSTRDNNVYGDTSIFKSNFNLSVMSNYPFIDFFCQFLLQLINHIKIKRIEEHSKNPLSQSAIDIKYVSKQLEQAASIIKPLYCQPIDQSTKLQFSLGQSKLNLNMSNLKQELSRDWAYRMLRLLDKDSLYEIFSLVMQQESLVFFSQSSYILTFMIYLFVGLIIHPFSYPHTIVSSVFQIDHLETPFIAIMGLNKPLKWLQQNQQLFMQKIEGKILVVLQEDEIKIKTKKKQKSPKSKKLKSIFKSFYQKIQKLQGSSKKKQILTREISKIENQITQQLLTQLQTFFHQELLVHLPNPEIIESIRKELQSTNANWATVSAKLIKTIEQFIIERRKNTQRDPFIDMLVQKQIFSVYLTIIYDIV